MRVSSRKKLRRPTAKPAAGTSLLRNLERAARATRRLAFRSLSPIQRWPFTEPTRMHSVLAVPLEAQAWSELVKSSQRIETLSEQALRGARRRSGDIIAA